MLQPHMRVFQSPASLSSSSPLSSSAPQRGASPAAAALPGASGMTMQGNPMLLHSRSAGQQPAAAGPGRGGGSSALESTLSPRWAFSPKASVDV